MRRRLLAITLASTMLVVVAFVIPLAGLVRSVARDRAVSGAERDAASLAPALASTDDTTLLQAAIQGTTTGTDGRLTIWLPDGTQLGDQTPADPDAIALTHDQGRAFSRHQAGGIEVYAPVVAGDSTSVVRARLPEALLEQGVTKAWVVLAGVGLALVALSGVIADRLGRSLTREASALAGTARTLAGGDPDARVAPGTTPELADAARALNLLADRIDELRSTERARVADLSHRLRTPLTALRLDAEAAGNDDLTAGVDRLEAAVTDLIRTAQRPLHEGALPPRSDLVAIVRERAAFWGALADDDQRTWRLDLGPEPSIEVGVGTDELAAAVDAVLGNVFDHTPESTTYAITLVLDPDGIAQLSVDDAGPGIPDPAAMRQRGHSSARSTGLGLDIARRAAQAAGGDLTISPSDLGGTSVTLSFVDCQRLRG